MYKRQVYNILEKARGGSGSNGCAQCYYDSHAVTRILSQYRTSGGVSAGNATVTVSSRGSMIARFSWEKQLPWTDAAAKSVLHHCVLLGSLVRHFS